MKAPPGWSNLTTSLRKRSRLTYERLPAQVITSKEASGHGNCSASAVAPVNTKPDLAARAGQFDVLGRDVADNDRGSLSRGRKGVQPITTADIQKSHARAGMHTDVAFIGEIWRAQRQGHPGGPIGPETFDLA